MIKVGLTGGIGSGKSTIAKIFIELGIPVYFSDVEAKRIIDNTDKIKTDIINQIGDIFVDGSLDRKKLAEIVFSDKKKLKDLNRIVYPWIAFDLEDWSIQKADTDCRYVLCESAIIIDTQFQKRFDYVITVSAPIKVRVERIMSRDKCTEKQAKYRINSQLSDKDREKKSNYIIDNSGRFDLRWQVEKIHRDIISKIKKLNDLTCH